MKLWHVSEKPGIAVFEPRLAPSPDAGVSRHAVWAIADSHLVNYLFPRECPRVTVRTRTGSSEADRCRFFGPASAEVVVFIEAPWLKKAVSSALWLYELPPASFECVDANAGYFVSAKAVSPIRVWPVESPLSELFARGAELRVVPRLRPVAEDVARSSLSYSIIRLRNAVE